MSRYWSKFRCFKGGGSLGTQIYGGKGRPPPIIFGIRKVKSLGYRMVKKIAEKFNRLSRVHQRHRQTDDRQTTDRQTTDGRPIAYSERNVVRSLKIKLTAVSLSCQRHLFKMTNIIILSEASFVFTARRYASTVYAVAVFLSVGPPVCQSVTRQYCTKTAKYRITQTRPSDYSFLTTKT